MDHAFMEERDCLSCRGEQHYFSINAREYEGQLQKKKYITKSERVKFNKNPLKYKNTFYDPIGQLGHTTIGMHSIKLTEAIPANEPPSRDLRYKRQTISDNMKLK